MSFTLVSHAVGTVGQ